MNLQQIHILSVKDKCVAKIIIDIQRIIKVINHDGNAHATHIPKNVYSSRCAAELH